SLNARNMSELPLGGQRKFSFFARTTPGVLPNEQGARDAAGGGFSANGVRSNGQNNFLLNGVDNNVNVIDMINQTAYVVGPSVEAIGEMRVMTNGYNAEYGRGGGGFRLDFRRQHREAGVQEWQFFKPPRQRRGNRFAGALGCARPALRYPDDAVGRKGWIHPGSVHGEHYPGQPVRSGGEEDY